LIKHPAVLAPHEHTVGRLKKYWEGALWKKIQDVEEREWRVAMEKKTKLRTYRTFKKKLELERYLLSEKEKEGRYLLTRLRTGTNKLRIETGRWKRPFVKAEDRVCLQCEGGRIGQIEDERHFLLHCSRYQNLRDELFQSIGARINTFWYQSAEGQWQILMSNEKKPGEVSDLLKKYVRRAMSLRQEE